MLSAGISHWLNPTGCFVRSCSLDFVEHLITKCRSFAVDCLENDNEAKR